MIYVISQNAAIAQITKEALKTTGVIEAPDSAAFLAQVIPRPYSKKACVIIDLATVPDAERIIPFTKASSHLMRLPIVVLGSQKDIDALPEALQSSVNGIVTIPYTAGELAAVIASVCEQPLPDIEPPEPK